MVVSSVDLIRLPTVILTNAPRDDTKPIPDIVPKPKSDVALYNHLSVMLNTGRPSSQVVAVTGFSESNAIKLTIVISSNSTDHIPGRHFSIDHVGPPPKPITADQVIQDTEKKCEHTVCLERTCYLTSSKGLSRKDILSLNISRLSWLSCAS